MLDQYDFKNCIAPIPYITLIIKLFKCITHLVKDILGIHRTILLLSQNFVHARVVSWITCVKYPSAKAFRLGQTKKLKKGLYFALIKSLHNINKNKTSYHVDRKVTYL